MGEAALGDLDLDGLRLWFCTTAAFFRFLLVFCALAGLTGSANAIAIRTSRIFRFLCTKK